MAAHEHKENGGGGDGVFNSWYDLEYLKSFPPGYRFAPTDEELIHYYLAKKIKKARLPPNCIVDQNIYRFHPMELLDRYREYGEKEWYFFTPRERKYRNGGRPSRTAAEGFWKASGIDKQIIRDDEIIGFRKALVYYTGKVPDRKKTNWIMHEYRVNEDEDAKKAKKENKANMRLDEWVLCRIYEKNERAAAASPNGAENNINQQHGVNIPDNIAAVPSPIAAENIHQNGVSDHNKAEAAQYDHEQVPQPPLMADDQQHHDVLLDDNSLYFFHDDYVGDSFLGFDSNLVFDPVVPYLYTSSEMQQQPYMEYNVMDDQQQQLLDKNYFYFNSFDQNPLPLNVLPPPPSSYDPLLDLPDHSNSVLIHQTNNYYLDDSFQQALLLPSPNSPGTAETSNYYLDDIIDSAATKRAKVK